jgi:hypothetical protein
MFHIAAVTYLIFTVQLPFTTSGIHMTAPITKCINEDKGA